MASARIASDLRTTAVLLLAGLAAGLAGCDSLSTHVAHNPHGRRAYAINEADGAHAVTRAAALCEQGYDIAGSPERTPEGRYLMTVECR